MLQREKGERKFQKQRQLAEREGKVIKACCRGRRERGISKTKMIAERKRKEIKPCCIGRGRREKRSFRTK